MSQHEQIVDTYRSTQKRSQKKCAVAKSKKEQTSATWIIFVKENGTNVVGVEEVEEVVVPCILGAQALRGPLHEDETHRAVGHPQDGTSTPIYRLDGGIEEGVPEAGLVHGQCHVQ